MPISTTLCLEELEPRIAPSGAPMLEGDKRWTQKFLKDTEAKARVAPGIMLPAITLPAIVYSSRGSGGTSSFYGLVSNINPALANNPQEAAILLHDPGINLAITSVAVNQLRDYFLEKENMGSRDKKTGRFVAHLYNPKPPQPRVAFLKMEPSEPTKCGVVNDDVQPDVVID